MNVPSSTPAPPHLEESLGRDISELQAWLRSRVSRGFLVWVYLEMEHLLRHPRGAVGQHQAGGVDVL
eukprot:CAMPEP_0182904794 /NCGR_PEP_ID=MMETSP0034_2-20130328/32398_1 /TAXON_ID=156128 /ORGANISM="Nephroselmis pyriformis, Strain CCMP717" /LENGTH=66 /DNA_ID=CAMNT_0025040021 /DNA_START=294 /DNA_END=491 /DNA_ORIENTATION=+